MLNFLKRHPIAIVSLSTLVFLLYGAAVSWSFEGPNNPPGIGTGSFGYVGNRFSVGTSTPFTDARIVIVASSSPTSTSAASEFALKIVNPNCGSSQSGCPAIFSIRNDGSVVMGGGNSGDAYHNPYSSTYDRGLTVWGPAFINSLLNAGDYVGTIGSIHISGGTFNNGVVASYSFPGKLGIATSTTGSIPQELSVYGNQYVSGSVGIGTTQPSSSLHIIGSVQQTDVISKLAYATSTGKMEGVAIGSGLTLSAGTLSAAAGGGGSISTSSAITAFHFPYWASVSGGLNGTSTLFYSSSTGNIGIGTSTPQALLSVGNTTTGLVAIFGGGQGKITAGSFDPVYTIGSRKYATYLPGMTGQKEETTGVARLRNNRYVIDFNKAREGSDLWLFSKTTALRKNFRNLSVLVTPNFDGKVWYEKDEKNNRLTLFADPEEEIPDSEILEISYRLTAPRFDADVWPNENHDKVEGLKIVDP